MSNRFRQLLLVITPVTLVVGVMIAAVITYLMPKQYETFAVIEPMFLPKEIKLLTESSPRSREIIETNITAAKQRLTSSGILEKVSQALDLPTRWDIDAQTSTRRLSEIIKVDQIDGTDLIRVRVRHTNREDAMDIIRTLLDVFTTEQKEEWEQFYQKQMRALIEPIREQEKVIANLRLEVQRIKSDSSQLTLPVSDLQQRLDQEIQRLKEMRLALLDDPIIPIHPTFGIIHDDPIIPDRPNFPDVRLNLILGSVAGLLLAFALMWVRRPVATGL